MLEDLGKLLQAVQGHYDYICGLWCGQRKTDINLKKRQVADIIKMPEIFDQILSYRSLMNDEMPRISFSLGEILFENSSVICRVKTQNSIEYKLENYMKHHENGKIPIKKYFNDLFGVRIITEETFSDTDIQKYIQENFQQYKCIDSSKGSYVATHIYLERSNFYFPWELQVWKKIDEPGNYRSHKQYKQEYTNWESINKGGD